MSGGAMGSLSRATDQASSAIEAARFAYQLRSRDRASFAESDTTLKNSLTELDDAGISAEGVEPRGTTEVATQERTLREIRNATDAVLEAQRRIRVAAPSAGTAHALKSAATELSKLSSQLERFQ
jgi:hypothetical protein